MASNHKLTSSFPCNSVLSPFKYFTMSEKPQLAYIHIAYPRFPRWTLHIICQKHSITWRLLSQRTLLCYNQSEYAESYSDKNSLKNRTGFHEIDDFDSAVQPFSTALSLLQRAACIQCHKIAQNIDICSLSTMPHNSSSAMV